MEVKVGCKNEWMNGTRDAELWCSPHQGSGEVLLFVLRNGGEIILVFTHTAGGPFMPSLNFLVIIPRVCQSLLLTLPSLEVKYMILEKISSWELLLHPPDGLLTPPAPPQVPLQRLQQICFQLNSSWNEATPKWTMKSWQPRTVGFSPGSKSSEQRSFKASQWCPFLPSASASAVPCPIHQWSNHLWNPRQGALKWSRYKIKIYRNMRSLAGFYDMHGAIPRPKPICYIYTPGLFIIPDTPPSVPHRAVAGVLFHGTARMKSLHLNNGLQ